MSPQLLSAGTMKGDDVVNTSGENLGEIVELMIDIDSGYVGYAVLSFGGVLGIGNKLFAIPWEALSLDTENKRFILDESKERLEAAPGFDKDNWPDMANQEWGASIHTYYGYDPYWQR